MKILSWNINGIRAIDRKGFFEWFQKESPDILCLQEIKALPEQFVFCQQDIEYYRFPKSELDKEENLCELLF